MNSGDRGSRNMNEQQAYSSLACNVIMQACKDFKKRKKVNDIYVYPYRVKLRKFFLGGLCDFYLGFTNINLTGEEIYKQLMKE